MIPTPSSLSTDFRRQRKSSGRSSNGCKTCRQRRVKCDEKRSRCGPCKRLDRNCQWGRDYTFHECNSWVQRQYQVRSPSHPGASGARAREDDLLRSDSSSPDENDNAPWLSSFLDEVAFEDRTPTHIPGSLYVHLTPEIFAKQILTPVSIPLSTPIRNSPPYGGSFEEEAKLHLQLYKRVVFGKLFPVANMHGLHIGADNEDHVISMAQRFPPVLHAVCAITSLAMALHGDPKALVRAFQHYDYAISASLSSADFNSEQSLYLHFLLLIFDACCAMQDWGRENPRCWSNHLEILARTVGHKPRRLTNQMYSCISAYVLFIDAQAGLAGFEESGAYVQSYLAKNAPLPNWSLSKLTQQPSPSNPQFWDEIHSLVKLLLTATAEMSQLTLLMRRATRRDAMSLDDCSRRVELFKYEFQHSWQHAYRRVIPTDTDEEIELARYPDLARIALNTAKMQYSAFLLYLYTNMYPKQRVHCEAHDEEVATHCTWLLSTVSQALSDGSIRRPLIIWLVFLAGVATNQPEQKLLAVNLLQAMRKIGIASTSIRACALLQLVHKEQERRVSCGGNAKEVDFIEVSRQYGLKPLHFTL